MRYLILALADDIPVETGTDIQVEHDPERNRLILRAGDRETYSACWIKCTPSSDVETQCDALLAQQAERRAAA